MTAPLDKEQPLADALPPRPEVQVPPLMTTETPDAGSSSGVPESITAVEQPPVAPDPNDSRHEASELENHPDNRWVVTSSPEGQNTSSASGDTPAVTSEAHSTLATNTMGKLSDNASKVIPPVFQESTNAMPATSQAEVIPPPTVLADAIVLGPQETSGSENEDKNIAANPAAETQPVTLTEAAVSQSDEKTNETPASTAPSAAMPPLADTITPLPVGIVSETPEASITDSAGSSATDQSPPTEKNKVDDDLGKLIQFPEKKDTALPNDVPPVDLNAVHRLIDEQLAALAPGLEAIEKAKKEMLASIYKIRDENIAAIKKETEEKIAVIKSDSETKIASANQETDAMIASANEKATFKTRNITDIRDKLEAMKNAGKSEEKRAA